MADHPGRPATTVRMLLPGPAEIGEVVPEDGAESGDVVQALADLYAYPDPLPRTGWVRASMVSTLDGSATGADGRSGSIGGPADRSVLSALRGLADVVLAGAGTARTEGYRVPQPKADFAERRARAGQRPAVQLALVTRSGRVPEAALTSESGYVVTCTSGPVAALRDRFGSERVVVAGDEDVQVPLAVAALVERGLPRVLLEGGPSLLGRALAAGRVDEICLTVSSRLVVGDGPRIALGPPTDCELRLAHLLDSGDALLGRWLVRRTDPGRSLGRSDPGTGRDAHPARQ